jgi:PAS domain S-box-containing protein
MHDALFVDWPLRAKRAREARVLTNTAELARAAGGLEKEIAERIKAEESYRASQQLLQGIVAFSDDTIISKRLDGAITSWNPAAERSFGFSAQQAVGQPMLILIPPERVSEERSDSAKKLRAEFPVHRKSTLRVRKVFTLRSNWRTELAAREHNIRRQALRPATSIRHG